MNRLALSTKSILLVVCCMLPLCHPFNVQPVSMVPLRTITQVFAEEEGGMFFASNDDDEEKSEATPPQPAAVPQPPKQPRRLDPLVASVTRVDPSMANAKTTNVPLFGEIAVDGSLVVLVPAAVIAVVGLVMSVVVAFNAKDTFVDQLTALSDDINAAALAKTNVVPDAVADGCRGLCSSQDEQLESMRAVMQGFAKK